VLTVNRNTANLGDERKKRQANGQPTANDMVRYLFGPVYELARGQSSYSVGPAFLDQNGHCLYSVAPTFGDGPYVFSPG